MSFLFELAQSRFSLGPRSVHGVTHWNRVKNFGLAIAQINGANANVITHFAYLHDACRDDDGTDELHGHRAAVWVTRLHHDQTLELSASEFMLLHDAIKWHCAGKTSKDPTIGACWDADRLDLLRVNVLPSERFFSTDAGLAILRDEVFASIDEQIAKESAHG